MVTDFHTHAFPDTLAERAMSALLAETREVTAYLDGRIESLLGSMDKAGIDRSVLCSIATKPSQFDPILQWSKAIRSERIVPLPSVHPADPAVLTRLDAIHDAGFKGIKLHPYYQDFELDDERLWPLFTRLAEHGMLLVCHTGFDVAFPRVRRCDPRRVRAVCDRFPALKFVATHLGAWEDWDEVETHLLGRDLYIEISYSLEVMAPDRAKRLILAHPRDRLLFGTDSPWQDQAAALRRLRALDLGAPRLTAMLEDNAASLLDR